MRVLVVTNEFDGHTRGTVIKDEAKIKAILAGENAHHVIKAEHADEPKTSPFFADEDE